MREKPFHYKFEWDFVKAEKNLQKHDIRFENAAEIFKDPLSISLFDKTHSDIEERWITLGQDYSGKLIVVVHTFEELEEADIRIRIISARKATKREVKAYQNG
ncbi:MAG: BrnT family toxin [Calditrichia bacterium]|nr:BrnT family toxin [Calditrichota bacterium]MCB0267962.1 BrnT family toxin [Calditrichota bacterium]MCB0285065.1 BrnT family toxin [Calditrichota bacterium]MCB9067812.1 BrnT family toxin [Calditrichia bacterium]